MRIESIRKFVILAEAGSFYGAAQRAPLSAQGFNKLLNSMENELGATLMERDRSGLTLTREGKVFLDFARALGDGWTGMLDDLWGGQGTGAYPGVSGRKAYNTHFALQVYSDFSSESDAALLSGIEEVSFRRLLEIALKGQGNAVLAADLGPSAYERILKIPNIALKPMFTTQMGVVTLRGSRLVGSGAVSPEALVDAPVATVRHAEMAHHAQEALGGSTLRNVYLVTDAERMLESFVRRNPEGALLYDSLSFYLARRRGVFPGDDFTFTPLDSPSSIVRIVQLYSRDTPLTEKESYVTDSYLLRARKNHAEYFEQYPIEDARAW